MLWGTSRGLQMQYMRTGETEGGAYDKRGFTYLASLGYSDSGECSARPMGPMLVPELLDLKLTVFRPGK